MTVGSRIRSKRKALGISMAELGKRLGITAAAISRYELGQRKVDYDLLERMADVMDIPVEDLLGLSADEKEEINIVENLAAEGGTRDRAEIRRDIIADKFHAIPYQALSDAENAADRAVLEAYSDIPDEQLRQEYISSFDFLTRRGRIEAVLRMQELTECYRFHATSESPLYLPEDK